jgi:hypothetical protein
MAADPQVPLFAGLRSGLLFDVRSHLLRACGKVKRYSIKCSVLYLTQSKKGILEESRGEVYNPVSDWEGVQGCL